MLSISLPHNVEPADRPHLSAFGRDVPAFPTSSREWEALVGIDLDAKPGVYPVAIDSRSAAGPLTAAYDLQVRPHKFPTRTLHVDEAFVNPPPDAQARIEREAIELHRLYDASATERFWRDPFVVPVPGQAVSRFGTRSIFNGQPRNPHTGADFLSPAGTPIHAPAAGRVVLARDQYFSGNTVLIDHGLGLSSLLAHLSSISVHEGDMVAAGTVVGLVGATGRVTGPHLHWAVRLNNARVDPLSLLAVLGPNAAK